MALNSEQHPWAKRSPYPSATPAHHPTVVTELGPAAAECLIRRISGDEVIATAWGTTILTMAEALPYRSPSGVTV